MQLLSDEFINTYPDSPTHMSEVGAFTFYRTYSRWLKSEKRRETWKETCRRTVEYNLSLHTLHMEEKGLPIEETTLAGEAAFLFDNMFNLRQFTSGRTLWVGGAESGVSEKYPMANFNCSFLNIEKYEDLGDMFYALLVGTGCGFRCSKNMASALPPIRNDISIIHSPYKPRQREHRLEDTRLEVLENGFAKMYIGDSKEGWVDALHYYFDIHTKEKYKRVNTLTISYNSIRPNGERLLTFGGTASGHEPLKEMFTGFTKVIRGEIDEAIEKPSPVIPFGMTVHEGNMQDMNKVHLRPIHILDMGNLVGNNVVSGGVRRTAEIFLCDSDDWECILAKYGINGIWDMKKHDALCEKLDSLEALTTWMCELKMNDANARPLHHRRMSNNSVVFTEKPSRELLHLLFLIMQGEGEPGFFNLSAAQSRRYLVNGCNPCGEILLDSKGVCNLTTVNVTAFLDENEGKYQLRVDALLKAQMQSARVGVRMTLVDLEMSEWDEVQKRDRLTGCSLTGWQDAMSKLNWSDKDKRELLNLLRDMANYEAARYAKELRIPTPLLVTTIKPEGSLSLVAGGISSGLHHAFSPYYIRRIRVSAKDALAKLAVESGWVTHPEVGQDAASPRTIVIDFPIASGTKRTMRDINAEEQMETYFSFQQNYTDHNSSNTIHVKPHEWERVEEIVWERWDDFIGVSFLADNGGNYALAPYEEITKEEYEKLKSLTLPFSIDLLATLESTNTDDAEIEDAECATGACPIR